MTQECPQCECEFKQLANHWVQSSSCDHPPFTQRQRELLKGLVMGDGCVSPSSWDGGDARMNVMSTNERWLRWLRAQFGVFATDVHVAQSGERIGERAREHSEFDNSGGAWEYSNIYRVDIRSHPHLTMMRERWYSDGDVQYPDDLMLTPVAAKAWYCSDGGLSWSDDTHAFAAFGTHNESHRPEYLCDLFQEHGFLPNWSEPLLRFSLADTAAILEWMGDAPAGFEYKWANESRERYSRLKAAIDNNTAGVHQ